MNPAEAGHRGPVRRIPPEAREGIMRVWLEILREQQPALTWLPVEREAGATAGGPFPSAEAAPLDDELARSA